MMLTSGGGGGCATATRLLIPAAGCVMLLHLSDVFVLHCITTFMYYCRMAAASASALGVHPQGHKDMPKNCLAGRFSCSCSQAVCNPCSDTRLHLLYSCSSHCLLWRRQLRLHTPAVYLNRLYRTVQSQMHVYELKSGVAQLLFNLIVWLGDVKVSHFLNCMVELCHSDEPPAQHDCACKVYSHIDVPSAQLSVEVLFCRTVTVPKLLNVSACTYKQLSCGTLVSHTCALGSTGEINDVQHR